jgi:hypothetical protein
MERLIEVRHRQGICVALTPVYGHDDAVASTAQQPSYRVLTDRVVMIYFGLRQLDLAPLAAPLCAEGETVEVSAGHTKPVVSRVMAAAGRLSCDNPGHLVLPSAMRSSRSRSMTTRRNTQIPRPISAPSICPFDAALWSACRDIFRRAAASTSVIRSGMWRSRGGPVIPRD